MSTIEKEYLNFDGLSTYDRLLKEYIETGLADKIDKSSTGYETITGNPLEFDSPSPQMVNMKCDIEASQDLHGYDKPWAGGAESNKAEFIETPSVETQHFTYSSNVENDITAVKDDSQSAFFASFEIESNGGTYTLNASLGEKVTVYGYEGDLSGTEVFAAVESLPLTFTLPQGTIVIGFYAGAGVPQGSTVYVRDFRANEGESDKGYEPYSNICPISGDTEVTIERCGKNLYNQSTGDFKRGVGSTGALISLPDNIVYASDYIRVVEGEEYIYTCDDYAGSVGVAFYDAEKSTIEWKSLTEVYNNNDRVTAPNGAVYARCTMYADNGQYGYFGLADIYSGREPYQGETYTIDLDGTRYGGQLDVTSGVLALTHGSITYSGSDVDLYSDNYENLRYARVPKAAGSLDRNTYTTHCISSMFRCGNLPSGDFDNPENIGLLCGNTDTLMYWIGLQKGITLQEAQNLIDGAQVIYELATPQTIQLTPTQVWAVQGGNTITVSVDGVEAEIHSSNYATLKDIENIPTAKTSEVTKGVQINPTTTPTTPGSVWITT